MSSLDNRWWMEFATRDNYLSCWLCFLFQIRFPRCSCVSCLVADQMFCFNYCQWRRRTRWPDEIQREWHCYWAAEIPWPGPGGRWQWAGCEAGRGWSVVTSGHHHTSAISHHHRDTWVTSHLLPSVPTTDYNWEQEGRADYWARYREVNAIYKSEFKSSECRNITGQEAHPRW